MSNANADIGLVGLGVMGQNLALNIADHGYTIAVYNRHHEITDAFVAHCREKEPSHERVLAAPSWPNSPGPSSARAKSCC
ncbi:NAD(P)-binding domain-containing protein [Methylogaea oryzae]|uniref:NAD(P)-binding domain-containing protein n=1 Tax=Methylogaea oryzae TaxID=1295382 RepID=UPI0006D01332|nr:NAD(P)-binding domain-containing protein [Methylogaea oryzae]